MIRYCTDRYLDVRLLWSSYSGYKIPASAVTELYYYMIPAEFLVTNEKSSQKGFYIQSGSGTIFLKPDIVMMTDDFCYVNMDDIKEGAVVIDVGIHRTENGLCGDCDYASMLGKASYITPVPGGVGPMTIAMLLSNCLKAYEQQIL